MRCQSPRVHARDVSTSPTKRPAAPAVARHAGPRFASRGRAARHPAAIFLAIAPAMRSAADRGATWRSADAGGHAPARQPPLILRWTQESYNLLSEFVLSPAAPSVQGSAPAYVCSARTPEGAARLSRSRAPTPVPGRPGTFSWWNQPCHPCPGASR